MAASRAARWPTPLAASSRAWRTASITSPPATPPSDISSWRKEPTMSLNVALAGAGAFGIKHLDAIKAIEGRERHLARRPRAGEDRGGRTPVRHLARHRRPGREPEDGSRSTPSSCARPRPCTLRRRSPASGPESTSRSKFPCATRWPTDGPWSRRRRPAARWRCAATRGASTRATSGCAAGS